MAKKEKDQAQAESIDSIFNKFLKEEKGNHYNDIEHVDYKVKTGSLNLDVNLDGGFGPGIHRFCGINEGGKTSCALQVAAHFQKEIENSSVVYIKAEGRLDKRLLARAGIDMSPEKLLILESNVCETVFSCLRTLVEDNPTNRRILFIIDSMDALIRKDDLEKPFTEAQKVAGGALITSTFLKIESLPITAYGHMIIAISQVRATIDMGHGPSTMESGGNALKHYATYVLEFRQRYETDKIYENPTAASKIAKGKIVGHFCKVLFKKSANEKTGTEIRYPIKYGQTNGKSIWAEMEILEMIKMWDLISKTGAWFNFTEQGIKILNEKGVSDIDPDYKVQGENGVLEFLGKRQDIVEAFANYFTDLMK